MTIFESLILGILQGITEFLPISSSGHLVLLQEFFGLSAENLRSFDVTVHLGTLLSILIYFRKDFTNLLKAFFQAIIGKISKQDPYQILILYLIIGTIPAVVFALLFEDLLDTFLMNPRFVAISMMIVGIVYIFAENFAKSTKKEEKNQPESPISGLSPIKVLIIGIFQAIAILPGVSRSGSTITAGLFQGLSRAKAARFSFLLGIPAILGAGVLEGFSLLDNPELGVGLLPLLIGFLSSFVFGFLSVSFLMSFIKKHSLKVFAVYLIVVGGLVQFFI